VATSTTTFPAGNVVVSAEYSGDANFTSSASPPILVLFLTSAQTAPTVDPAGIASDAIAVGVGFDQVVIDLPEAVRGKEQRCKQAVASAIRCSL
jgi:hypothetical protein